MACLGVLPSAGVSRRMRLFMWRRTSRRSRAGPRRYPLSRILLSSPAARRQERLSDELANFPSVYSGHALAAAPRRPNPPTLPIETALP